MKKQNMNNQEREEVVATAKSGITPDPNHQDTPKPDGETASGNEEEDEIEKPGDNIFK
ncbi:hypothetical protein [Aquimarina aquimarini]|uniref:hypothetical protein n=1 Tax=Aquimarina aquimarini TaxID=1191734 RepID=UPI00131EF15C|nr:hypothetical protein [Aquimarina aquimarini]